MNHLFCKLKLLTEAMILYKEMKKEKVKMSGKIYHDLITLSCELNLSKEALSIFDSMKKRGFNPDKKLCNLMLNLIRALMLEMRKRGEKPEIVDYNRLIGLSAQLYSTKPDNNDSHVPGTTTYRDLRPIEELLNWMKEDGVNPNQTTFNILVSMFFSAGQQYSALKISGEMISTGFSLDVYTYTSMLANFGEGSSNILNEMNKNEVSPNIATYNTRIHLKSKSNKAEEETQLILNEMKEKNIQPDIITYNTLIHMFAKNNHPEKAIIQFNMMKEKGILPDKYTYSTLAQMYAKLNQTETTLSIIEEMKENHVEINSYTYHALIELHVRESNPEKSLSILKEMITRGIKPETCNYNPIIEMFLKNENPKEALNIYDSMIKAGVKPDSISHSSLVNIYADLNRWNDIIILIISNPHSFEPSMLYNLILSVFIKKARVQDALSIYNEMKLLSILDSFRLQRRVKFIINSESRGTRCELLCSTFNYSLQRYGIILYAL